MQPLDYRVEDTMQFVEVTGEFDDVRLYAEKLIDATNKDEHMRAHHKEQLEQICYDPLDHHQYHLNSITRIYYFPNKILVHPWSSKPSPFFDIVKKSADEAWEQTIHYLQEGSDIE